MAIRFTNLRLCLGLLALTASLTGCDEQGNKLLQNAPGDYDGFVIQNSDNESSQLAVSAKVAVTKEKNITVHIASTEAKKESFDFLLHTDNNANYVINSSSGLFPEALVLSKSKDSKYCYASPTTANHKIRFCFDGTEISVGLTLAADLEYIFALDRHDPKKQVVLEAPKPYTVSEILAAGKNQSFTSQMQFETAVKSRLSSQASYLNLLPHLSLGSVTGIIAFQPSSLVNLVGDLAPFLIPSNWFNANATGWQSSADYYAWLLMKANSGNIAEGLAYVVLRDKATLASLDAYIAPLEDMRETVHKQEIMGLLPKGSVESASTLLVSIQENKARLQELIASETRDLAIAIGLTNPDGISEVVEDSKLSLDTPLSLNKSDTEALVIARSLELKQVDSLMRVEKDRVLSKQFSWASPSGSIAFGILSDINSEKASVTQLAIQRRQLQAMLLEKIRNANDELDYSLKVYTKTQAKAATLKSRFDRLKEDLNAGFSFSMQDLQNMIQAQVKSDGDVINAKYTYYTAVGKINRMLISGAYADILTRASASFEPKQ